MVTKDAAVLLRIAAPIVTVAFRTPYECTYTYLLRRNIIIVSVKHRHRTRSVGLVPNSCQVYSSRTLKSIKFNAVSNSDMMMMMRCNDLKCT